MMEGLERGVLYQRPDKSVWCDLTDEGLDENCCCVEMVLRYI